MKLFTNKHATTGRVGLSISDSCVAFAYLRGDELVSCDYGLIQRKQQASEVLTSLIKQYKLAGNKCTFVLQGSAYQLFLIEAPAVDEHEMAAAVRWRVKDSLDYPLQEAVVDYFDLPPEAYRGTQKMVYVIAARKAVLELLVEQCRVNGLSVDCIDIRELVFGHVMGRLDDQLPNKAFVYLDEDTGFINLSHNASICLNRALEVGVRQLQQSHVDSANSDDFSFSDIDALVLELQRSIDYYESHLGFGSITQLCLPPASNGVPQLPEQLNRNLDMRVRELQFADLLGDDKGIDADKQRFCFAALSAGLRGH